PPGGRQPRPRRPLHRLRRHPRGAGEGDRREVRLVPGRGRRQGAAAHQRQEPRAALQGRVGGGPGEVLPADADQGVPRPDHAGLRGDRTLSRRERWLGAGLCAPALMVLGAVFLWPLAVSVLASLTRDGALTLAHYETVWRLYRGDVLYTIGVAAAGT